MWFLSAVFSALGDVGEGIPEEVMKRENCVYNIFLGQFHVVVPSGKVIEVQGVNALLMK